MFLNAVCGVLCRMRSHQAGRRLREKGNEIDQMQINSLLSPSLRQPIQLNRATSKFYYRSLTSCHSRMFHAQT